MNFIWKNPQALPHPDQELEFFFRQLKQQVEQKSNLLDQVHLELVRIENKLISFQRQYEEKTGDVSDTEVVLIRQLFKVEEEKQQVEIELSDVHQLVFQLTEQVEEKKHKLKLELPTIQPQVITLSEVEKKNKKLKRHLLLLST